MKFFMLETNEKNRNPLHINKNRAVDIRLLTKEHLSDLPLRTVLEMDFQEEGFFPDLICNPFLMLSITMLETIMIYKSDVEYKVMKLWDRNKEIHATYYFPLLEELDVMSDKTRFNSTGNRIVNLVLCREKIAKNVIFRVKGLNKNCIIGKMDFVESILRRKVRGLKITEIDTDRNL